MGNKKTLRILRNSNIFLGEFKKSYIRAELCPRQERPENAPSFHLWLLLRLWRISN
jgi:hypothetical protein